jgi:hypothetical protein
LQHAAICAITFCDSFVVVVAVVVGAGATAATTATAAVADADYCNTIVAIGRRLRVAGT